MDTVLPAFPLSTRQFHELSLRQRVLLSQFPLTVATVLLYASIAAFDTELLSRALVQWAGALHLVLVLACAAIPWDRLPYRSFLVIPVLNFLPIGLLREGTFPEVMGTALLPVFPVLWLVASAQFPRAGAALGALLTLLMVWAPVLLSPQRLSFESLTSPLLIPLMMLAIGTTAQMLNNSMEAKDAQLRQLLGHSARRERLLDTILDAVDVGVLAIDAHGHDVLMNRRQQRIHRLGLPAGLDDAPEADLLVFGGDGTTPLPAAGRPAARAVRGESFSHELIRIGAPPGQRVLSVSSRVMTDERRVREGAVLSFTDVTDLVAALQAQDELVAGVSHELRTPLTSIRGYTELLTMDGTLPGPVLDGLEVIERNADQLLVLVNDLLTTRSTTEDLHRVPVDLVAVLHQATAAAQPHATHNDITLRTWTPETLVVDCDPVRIRQVLDNVITNAIKYSPAHTPVFVMGTQLPHAVQIEVIDHGRGMDPGDTAKIFNRFYRSATARMSTTPGLGIGLALSKNIIDQHNGTITCHSTPGEGTVLTITLPTTGAAGTEAEPT